MYHWIFIILLSSICCGVQAQDSLPAKPQNNPKKPLSKKFVLHKDSITYRIGLDLIGTAQAFFVPKFAVHINTDLAFRNKNLLVMEYTWAKRQESQVASYQSQGSIVRIGWLHNFLHKQSKQDIFGMGARIATAWIAETVEATIENPIFGSEAILFQQNLRATWLELNMELKARIWKNLYTGYCLRYQFRSSPKGEILFSPYSIPSVGRIGRNNWGFQYGVWYRF